MPSWPGTVPQSANVESLSEEDQESYVEFPVEVGIPKRRARTTMVVATLVYDKLLTWTQWDLLQTFYRSDCKKGTLSFTRNHPRTAASLLCIWTKPPKATSVDGTYCRVSISNTILPVSVP